MTPKRWLLNNLKVVDIWLNVFWLASEEVCTLSRRAGLARRKGKRWGCVLCAALNPVARWIVGQEDHCDAAAEADKVF